MGKVRFVARLEFDQESGEAVFKRHLLGREHLSLLGVPADELDLDGLFACRGGVAVGDVVESVSRSPPGGGYVHITRLLRRGHAERRSKFS